eukprot:6479771-Amphidinium_carterae.2
MPSLVRSASLRTGSFRSSGTSRPCARLASPSPSTQTSVDLRKVVAPRLRRVQDRSASVVKWPILFRPVPAHPEPVLACVQWLFALKHADQCRGTTLSWIRAVVAKWLRSSVKCSISIAGIYLAQLMQWWEADVDTCVERICTWGSDRDLATLFVYAAGCAMQLQCVVVTSDGRAEGSFIQTRGYGLLQSGKGWCVIAPFNDAECILNELLSIGTISDTLEYISPCPAHLDVNEDGLEYVEGGGAGREKRKRVASPELQARGDIDLSAPADAPMAVELFWPPWRLAGDEETTIPLHVTVGLAPPEEICIPALWTKDESERAFASHLALRVEWLDFTWVESDVSIELSLDFPVPHLDAWHQLHAAVSAMPPSARRRRNLTMGSETILGHRASRRRGLTSYTTQHEAEVASLVSAVNALIPGATYNAIALVAHSTTPTHRDTTNDPLCEMYIIPHGPAIQSWMWIESTTGCALLPFELQEVSGSWFPLNRILCFAASLAHKVHSEEDCASLVLYRTARVPKRAHLTHLAQLGFPLSIAELERMAEDDAPEDETMESAEEQVAGASSTDSLLWDYTPQLPAQTERIPMFKAKKDGNLRRISLQIGIGSSVQQAIMIIKRFLKLNPARLQLAHWNSQVDLLPALPMDHIVSMADGPYLIRVAPSGEASAKVNSRGKAQGSIPSAQATLQSASLSTSRPIGAPLQPASAMMARPIGAPSPRDAVVIGASSVRSRKSAATPLQQSEDWSGDVSAGAAAGSDSAAANTPFETWVISKLSAIEIQQEQLWTEVRSIRAALTSSAAPTSTATAPWRSGGAGSRQFVQGGGRFQKVQQDTVARSSLALFSDDLAALDCSLLNEKLVRHVFFSDKKCTLAVFQAKSRKQRFYAVSAALTRMGMAELSASLLQFIQQDVDAGLPQQTARSSSQGVFHQTASPLTFGPPQSDLLSQLRNRVSAVEAWAHALDSSQAVGDGESATAMVRANELIEALVKQAVMEVTTPPSLGAVVVRLEQLESQVNPLVASAATAAVADEPDETTPSLHSRITILEKKTEECLSAYAKLICEKGGMPGHPDTSSPAANPYHLEGGDADLPGCASDTVLVPDQLARCDVRVQLAALSNQVEFCMKMCRRSLTSNLSPSATATGPADQLVELKQMCQRQSVKTRQMDELLRMHTTAISRTWQWTSSVVQSLSMAPWMRSVSSTPAAATGPCRHRLVPSAVHPTVETDKSAAAHVVHDNEKVPEVIRKAIWRRLLLALMVPQQLARSVSSAVWPNVCCRMSLLVRKGM